MLEIAKALRSNVSILILDEPTAALTERETDRLFQLIRECRRQGAGIIYITHRMNEIHRIGDRITVLRDGRRVATLEVSEATGEKLVELMTGRRIEAFFPRVDHDPGEELLAVEGLGAGSLVRDVSLTVCAGEIVGLAGLVGSGKSEVGRACFGIEPVHAGSIRFRGRPVTRPHPGRCSKQVSCTFRRTGGPRGWSSSGTCARTSRSRLCRSHSSADASSSSGGASAGSARGSRN